MKKAEFEAILLDCEQLKRLCEERKKCSPCAPPLASVAPVTRVRKLEAPASTPGSGGRNSLKFYSFDDLHRLKIAGAHEDPAESLRLAIERYRKHPSETNATKLEMAINRLGLTSAPDDKGKKLIAKAIEALGEKTEEKGESGFKGDNIAVTLWEHSNSHGSQLFVNLTFGGSVTGWQDLRPVNFNDKISSLKLQVSADELGGRVFLFQNDRFLGRYVQFDAAPGTDNDVGYVGGFINDRTTSVLIYRQFPNEIIQAVGDFVPPGTIEAIINATGGISTRGAPIFTWDLFPAGNDGHPNDSSRMFIYLRIPITVDVPHWFDYDAEIRFWISPFVDQTGHLQTPLNYFGAWVEGGILSGSILDQLMGEDGIPLVLGQVTNLLMSAASVANLASPFSGLYMLPGRADAQGHTDDNVTIVLLQGPPPTPGPIL